MTQLLSMLVPLQTLPGWPTAPTPTVLQELALFVGAPLLVIALVAVITRVHHAVKGNVGTPSVANQPIWVNGRRVEPSVTDDTHRESIEAGHRAAASQLKDEDDSTGGAGARW